MSLVKKLAIKGTSAALVLDAPPELEGALAEKSARSEAGKARVKARAEGAGEPPGQIQPATGQRRRARPR